MENSVFGSNWYFLSTRIETDTGLPANVIRFPYICYGKSFVISIDGRLGDLFYLFFDGRNISYQLEDNLKGSSRMEKF